MIIKRKKDQKVIKSPLCGNLIEVIKNNSFGIVKAVNIGTTGKHYHKIATETYHLLSGELVILVEKGNERSEVILKSGDVLVLEPFDVHKIVKASDRNEMIVTNVPEWQAVDEIEIKE